MKAPGNFRFAQRAQILSQYLNFRIGPRMLGAEGKAQGLGSRKYDHPREPAEPLNMIQVVAQFASIACAAVRSREIVVEVGGPTVSFVRVRPTDDSTAMTPAILWTTIFTAALTARYRMIRDSSHCKGLVS